jgi:hypothetical protein
MPNWQQRTFIEVKWGLGCRIPRFRVLGSSKLLREGVGCSRAEARLFQNLSQRRQRVKGHDSASAKMCILTSDGYKSANWFSSPDRSTVENFEVPSEEQTDKETALDWVRERCPAGWRPTPGL